MNRNIILGQDWLIKNGVRMYYDLGCLRVNNTYVPLIEDIHTPSVVRLKSTPVLKPHDAYICKGRVKNNPQYQNKALIKCHQLSKVLLIMTRGRNDKCCHKTRWIRVMPCTHSEQNRENEQNEKKGCVIEKVSLIDEECIHQINTVNTNVTNRYTREALMTELNFPEQYKEFIINRLEKNLDILAKKQQHRFNADRHSKDENRHLWPYSY